MSKLLVCNGSPRPNGTVATLLRTAAEASGMQINWVDVYQLQLRPCIGCMQCRETGRCALPDDDGHRMAERIARADALLVGTPTYWANMSGPLKMLFDRIVAALIVEQAQGFPKPLHRGQPAAIITACTVPWPFHTVAGSRETVRAVRGILGMAGYRIVGTHTRPGTRMAPELSARDRVHADTLGARIGRKVASQK